MSMLFAKICIRSCHNFAHVTTAHVQNCDLIRSSETKLQKSFLIHYNIFLQDLDYELIKRLQNLSQTVVNSHIASHCCIWTITTKAFISMEVLPHQTQEANELSSPWAGHQIPAVKAISLSWLQYLDITSNSIKSMASGISTYRIKTQ